MARCAAILVGLMVLLGTGALHGFWTERWHRSPELEQAAQRMTELPNDIGDWKGEVLEQDADALALAGAVGYYGRRFTNQRTGESVQVFLMCGRAGRMSVHRPQDCYQTAGFVLMGPPIHCQIQPPGHEASEMWTGVFTKETATGPVQLRIFWAWGAAGAWTAPEVPRLAFARAKALYKLYLVRECVGPPGPIVNDPCVTLFGQLMPELGATLFLPVSAP
jgi:hypothetical protein